MKMVKEGMEDVGLEWNPKKGAVVNMKRFVRVNGTRGLVWGLEEGKQYKFFQGCSGECAAREYLRHMSMIWSSPLSYQKPCVSKSVCVASSWISHVDATVDIVVENGGRHPCGLSMLLYLPRSKGGRGLRSVEMEYKATKIKMAVKLW